MMTSDSDSAFDGALQKRISELAGKANEGELSEEERVEYEGYIQVNRIAAILQAHSPRRNI
jgi:hypothetical protein